MKVCILANSHVHMLKIAADAQPPSGWTPTFFGAPATGLRKLRRIKGGLGTKDEGLKTWLVRTSGGQDRIRFSDYDAFVIFGLALRPHGALQQFTDFQPYDFAVTETARLISHAAFRAAVRERLEKSAGARMMRYLGGRSPVIVVPAPVPKPALAKRPGFEWINAERGPRALRWATGVAFDEVRDMAAQRGFGFLSQPPDTLDETGFTKAEFAYGSARLTGSSYDEDDISHMNAAFGQIMLDAIGAALR